MNPAFVWPSSRDTLTGSSPSPTISWLANVCRNECAEMPAPSSARATARSIPFAAVPLLAELARLRTRYRAGSSSVEVPRVGDSHGDVALAVAAAVYQLDRFGVGRSRARMGRPAAVLFAGRRGVRSGGSGLSVGLSDVEAAALAARLGLPAPAPVVPFGFGGAAVRADAPGGGRRRVPLVTASRGALADAERLLPGVVLENAVVDAILACKLSLPRDNPHHSTDGWRYSARALLSVRRRA